MLRRGEVRGGGETHGGRMHRTALGGINAVQTSLGEIAGVVPDNRN